MGTGGSETNLGAHSGAQWGAGDGYRAWLPKGRCHLPAPREGLLAASPGGAGTKRAALDSAARTFHSQCHTPLNTADGPKIKGKQGQDVQNSRDSS